LVGNVSVWAGEKMLDAIAIFLIGLLCGIVAGRTHVSYQRKKIKFYESYIHRRLEENVPRASEQAKHP
jgi:hypothetical protein